MDRTLLTFGHGTAGPEELLRLLVSGGVRHVVDVRRFPASRRHPHVHQDVLAEHLATVGTSYRWEPRFGGRRSLPKGVVPTDSWWQVKAFAAYAAHTRTPEFVDAVAELVSEVDRVEAQDPRGRVAVMCSEALWWRCHRRLIADVAVLTQKCRVLHLMHDGRLSPHPSAVGARVVEAAVVWDVADRPGT